MPNAVAVDDVNAQREIGRIYFPRENRSANKESGQNYADQTKIDPETLHGQSSTVRLSPTIVTEENQQRQQPCLMFSISPPVLPDITILGIAATAWMLCEEE
jgi:hypothetical protein